jgi:lauroyl/myristoyl acyltransferase
MLSYFFAMSIWKKMRYKLEWFGMQMLYTSIPLLPRVLALWISKRLGLLGFAMDKRGRNTAIENLTLIFGGEKNDSEIRELAKQSYQSFAQTVVDQFWSKRLTTKNIDAYCTIEAEDWDTINEAKKTGAIWVTPHYSNFEWIALSMGFRGYSFTIVAQDFKNESLTEIYKRNREISGHKVISQRGALRQLLKGLKRQGHAAFLTDLTIPPSRAATIIECFGRKTSVTSMHAELMKRTGLPVIPGICIPRDDGSYLLKGFKALKFGPEDNEQTIAQACWNVFEPYIRENPAPWLWMYKHWRYLPKGEEDRYPSYARENQQFDQVCERIGI